MRDLLDQRESGHDRIEHCRLSRPVKWAYWGWVILQRSRVQHEGHADAGIVMRCGVSHPIINIPSRYTRTCLFQEGNVVYAHVF